MRADGDFSFINNNLNNVCENIFRCTYAVKHNIYIEYEVY